MLLQEWSQEMMGLSMHNAGTTPVYHMGDPLQGSGDPWASTTPWLSFSPGVSSAALPSTPIGLPSQFSPGGSGQSGNTATFGMPPGFLDPGPTQAPTPAVDPVMAQLLRQQMLLTQGVMDLLYRTEPGLPQQPVQQTPTVAQNSAGQSDFFFSGMADHALRLGPYMRRSRLK